MKKRFMRGAIWRFFDREGAVGSEQQGERIWLIISNNKFNEESSLVQAIPGTRYIHKENRDTNLESQVIIGQEYGLRYDTVFMAEQMMTLDQSRAIHYITRVDDFKMLEVNEAMAKQYGLFEYFNEEHVKSLINELNLICEQSLMLNYCNRIHDKEIKLAEIKTYCTKYGYDAQMFLDKYLMYKKEVEQVG